MQSLKKIQIRPDYAGTLEALVQEFLRAVHFAAKDILIRVPLMETVRWKSVLQSLIAESKQRVSILFGIPTQNSSFTPEAIVDQIRTLIAGKCSDFNPLFLSILDSPIPIAFGGTAITEKEPVAGITLIINDGDGEIATFKISVAPGGPFRMAVVWSWGDPDCVASKAVQNFRQVWAGCVENGCTGPSLRQTLREILSADSLPSISGIEKLFPHQTDGISRWVKNQYRGIFEMCTGAGKTIAALAALKTLLQDLGRGKRDLSVAVVVCPTQVLVEQWECEVIQAGFEAPLCAYDSIQNYVPRLGICLNGTRHSGLRIVITTDVTFSSPPFMNEIKKATEGGTKALLIADEMHNYSSPSARQALRLSEDYFAFRLGLSATPEVEGNESASKFLSDYFGRVVGEYSLRQAIQENVLCSYKYYPCPIFLDGGTSVRYLETLRQIGNETERVNPDLYRQRNDLLRRSGVQINALESIVDGICAKGHLSHTLVFCPPGRDSTDEQERLLHRVKKVFEERGILTTSIVAGTPARERPAILKDFAAGEFQVLLAIGCLDEGMNVPCTERAIMLYSLDRSRQFIQRRGRILRRAPGKKFAIINDIVILPHNAEMSESEAKGLLRKEMRRYGEFASMAMNKDEAQSILDKALEIAVKTEGLECLKA